MFPEIFIGKGEPILRLAYVLGLGLFFACAGSLVQEERQGNQDEQVAFLEFINTKSRNALPQEPDTNLHQIKMEKLENIIEEMRQGKAVNILCFGNSITNGFKVNGFGQVDLPYPQHLEDLLRKKYENDSISVINEGHNGWRCTEALPYLPRILEENSPDLIIMMFGINDAYSSYRPDYYALRMEKMIQLIQEKECALILMNPSPIATHLNTRVLAYTPVLQELARKYEISFFNLYEGILARAKAEEISLEILLPDQVHLADDQYAWIGDLIFESFFQQTKD